MSKLTIITFVCFFIIYVVYGISLQTNDSSVGPCLDKMCMEGYECKNDLCYKISQNISSNNFSSQIIGPCVNGNCPDGYVCKEDSCYLQ
ncbi:Hypothetical protein SRAE_X000238800 [Strongyloides ratti]|uniref:CC domain-containing protein n=1 Tax=Strongyloides ratti TaxID=34506 RepID=A0A090KZL8_STRRB|nr:Hypothetical protein SRAE_X000238800 [Strongyloides ratti]CEF60654.1 Hypothetical protein SRAE_X000238800 [Strongyloides ratti]